MEAFKLFWSDNIMTGAASSSVCGQCWAGAYSTVFGISRLGCLGEADRNSARPCKIGNMLALMRVETGEELPSSEHTDSFIHWHRYMSFPRLHDAIYIRCIKRARKHDSE